MRVHALLWNRDGRLRFVWAACVFSLGTFAAWSLAHRVALPDGLVMPVFAVLTLLWSLYCVRVVEHRPSATLGLAWQAFSARQWWGGWMMGTLPVCLVMLTAVVAGGAQLALAQHGIRAACASLAPEVMTIIVIAGLEELLFRGYLFQIALERMPATLAVVLFAAAFAGAHMNNPHASALAIVNTFLAGVWLATAYLRTRQLWLPIALHASWNFTLGALWGAGLSGFTTPHLLHTELLGSTLLTGGDYGPEAGVLCTIAMVLGIAAIYAVPWFQESPDQFALRHRVRHAEDYERLFGASSESSDARAARRDT